MTSTADRRAARTERPLEPATYERPVEAKLWVHLSNGDKWEATGADLERFRLVSRLDAYMAFDDAYREALVRHGLVGDGTTAEDGTEARYSLTDAELNPMRYLVETAISMPQLLDHPEHEGWAMVADLERRLRANPAPEED